MERRGDKILTLPPSSTASNYRDTKSDDSPHEKTREDVRGFEDSNKNNEDKQSILVDVSNFSIEMHNYKIMYMRNIIR